MFQDRIYIMGVVNVTPDSFSDGGDFLDPQKAIDHGLRLLEDGADILDIGGESTRPGAVPVAPDEEQRRVLPVIKGLSAHLKQQNKYLSIDTRHASTMRAAIDCGANFINDVSALTDDPQSLHEVIRANVPVCLMHKKGQPQDMQKSPDYKDVLTEVKAFFEERIAACEAAGLSKEKLILDPGIGFGKTLAHNLTLIHNLSELKALGCPVLLGVSRKSFIQAVMNTDTPTENRLSGSLAAALYGVQSGATILRVHDVAETHQALKVWQAIKSQ